MKHAPIPALTPFAGLRWQHPPACLRSQQLQSLCECKTGQPDARLAPMHDACFVIGRAVLFDSNMAYCLICGSILVLVIMADEADVATIDLLCAVGRRAAAGAQARW